MARRLRRHQLQAGDFTFAVKADLGWIGGRYATPVPIDDSRVLMHLAAHMLRERWRATPVSQVQLTAPDPHRAWRHRDLFERPRAGDRAADRIAEKYGDSALLAARLLGRSGMPDVIAPAWKQSEHGQTIHR